jgi:hypothetical protein
MKRIISIISTSWQEVWTIVEARASKQQSIKRQNLMLLSQKYHDTQLKNRLTRDEERELTAPRSIEQKH